LPPAYTETDMSDEDLVGATRREVKPWPGDLGCATRICEPAPQFRGCCPVWNWNRHPERNVIFGSQGRIRVPPPSFGQVNQRQQKKADELSTEISLCAHCTEKPAG